MNTFMISTNALVVHPFKTFIHDSNDLCTDLLDTIRQTKVITPLKISCRTGQNVVIDGYRRMCAAKLLGISDLEVAIDDSMKSERDEVDFILYQALNHQNISNRRRVLFGLLYENYISIKTRDHTGLSLIAVSEKVGLKKTMYSIGKFIMLNGSQEIKTAWLSNEISYDRAVARIRQNSETPNTEIQGVKAKKVHTTALKRKISVIVLAEMYRVLKLPADTIRQAIKEEPLLFEYVSNAIGVFQAIVNEQNT
jgi:ParB-like nuclease domain